MNRLAVLGFALLATPVVAQTNIGTVRAGPFDPTTSRPYDASGNFVGTARESPFVGGEVRLYDRSGRPTGIEVRENVFDPSRSDLFDTRVDSDK